MDTVHDPALHPTGSGPSPDRSGTPILREGRSSADPASAPLRLFTLGRLAVEDAGGTPLSARRKDLVLLAYLASRAPQAATRADLAALLWEGRGEARARHSLRQALVQLRALTGDELRADEELVWLTATAVETDAALLERHFAAARYREAVLCYAGEFLSDGEGAGGQRFRRWVLAEREKLDLRYLRALEALLRESLSYQRWVEAVEWAQRWAAADPLGEEPHSQLIIALHLAGRTGEALAAHSAFRVRLKAELGEVPTAEFERIREKLQRESLATVPATPTGDSRGVASPEFVGRDAELQLLMDAWSAIRIGSPGLAVLIDGPAGVGKSRLAEELVQRLAAEPVVVLHARARAEDHTVESSAARALLAGVAAAPGLAASSEADRAELALLVPSIRDRFSNLPSPVGGVPELHDASARILAEVAYQVPAVLILDDFPRADPTSRRWVENLVHHPTAGLLILLLGRSEEIDRLDDFVWPAARIGLKPLREVELDAMIASMLYIAPTDRQLLGRRLRDTSDGNPRFASELLRTLADCGQLVPDPAGAWHLAPAARDDPESLPMTIAEAISRRLAVLSPTALRTLAAASMLERRATLQALLEIGGSRQPGSDDAVTELVARRLLHPASDAPDRYEPANDIVGRLVLERLTPEETRDLQRTIARWDSAVARATDATTRSSLAAPWLRWSVAVGLLVLLALLVTLLVRQ